MSGDECAGCSYCRECPACGAQLGPDLAEVQAERDALLEALKGLIQASDQPEFLAPAAQARLTARALISRIEGDT